MFQKNLLQFVMDKGKTEWFTFAHAVMGNKSQPAYEAVLNAIKDKWKELEVEPRFKYLITDFEAAELYAVQAVFGTEKVQI